MTGTVGFPVHRCTNDPSLGSSTLAHWFGSKGSNQLSWTTSLPPSPSPPAAATASVSAPLGLSSPPSRSPLMTPSFLPVASFDLKGFIGLHRRSPGSTGAKRSSPPVRTNSYLVVDLRTGGDTVTPPRGTRWNPTQEQIGILETLYGGGMRTPDAQQIEQITAQLRNYGKIEGKNVFYWFQNHKARERQKQKRNNLRLDRRCCLSSPTCDSNTTLLMMTPVWHWTVVVRL
ncbi:hypothetical protein SAY87_031048 [Trapa incisa]|uniref:Homeobox domain-containing protein n=1 Tax=Trapa incisa TaxID=236973 RepID=A0AAN7KNJ4_9MYRT|nr:hypothetical protein SAY87_031048 [Trapa incisa]